jgi:hypothetical protein
VDAAARVDLAEIKRAAAQDQPRRRRHAGLRGGHRVALLAQRAQLVAAGAGDEHVHAVDRGEPAVEVAVGDQVDRRPAGERGPDRLLVRIVAVRWATAIRQVPGWSATCARTHAASTAGSDSDE